jgi:hypothetical protein
MNNITELRAELSKLFNDLKAGEVEVKTASEMNNSAGKIINTIKVELEYFSMLGDKPDIEYLKKGTNQESKQ